MTVDDAVLYTLADRGWQFVLRAVLGAAQVQRRSNDVEWIAQGFKFLCCTREKMFLKTCPKEQCETPIYIADHIITKHQPVYCL